MQYRSEKPDNSEDFETIRVDDKTFYCKKENVSPGPKRRYSDQFKDPLFKLKDDNRKLTMIKQFIAKHGNIDRITQRYKECISECIEILQKEGEVNPSIIFSHFNLKKYGFDPNDYGIIEDDENKEDEQ